MASAQRLKINQPAPNSATAILSYLRARVIHRTSYVSEFHHSSRGSVSLLTPSDTGHFSLASLKRWDKNTWVHCCDIWLNDSEPTAELVIGRNESPEMNLQLRNSSQWSQPALAELPQLKIRNVLNVSVCQIFFSFLFELRDGFSVILRPPPSSRLGLFPGIRWDSKRTVSSIISIHCSLYSVDHY